MVNHCANPACHKVLHYLREGKVFLFSWKNSGGASQKLPQKLEHYWLCGKCAKAWTLIMDEKDSVQLAPLKKRGTKEFPSSSLAPVS